MNRKTTVYLPDELKAAVEREARHRGVPEAEVIRQAIAHAVGHVRPRPGILDGDPVAANADEFLAGFGVR